MDRNKKSDVWKHFTKVNADSAKCRICKSILKCKGGSTSTLRNHLKLKHKINMLVKNDEKTGDEIQTSTNKLPEPGGTNRMEKYLKRESLAHLLAKCAAKDGFSVRGIVNSTAIKEFVASRGYIMPRSEATVRKLIVDFYMEKKTELKNRFHQLCYNHAIHLAVIDVFYKKNIIVDEANSEESEWEMDDDDDMLANDYWLLKIPTKLVLLNIFFWIISVIY